MLKKISQGTAVITLLAAAGIANAGVSGDEAAKLKTTLTPLGAERSGNAAGTIPPWDGGLTKVAKPGEPVVDQFSDKPILTLTAANFEQHQANLAEGTMAMFKKHSDFRMQVYKTQRTAAAPQWVYDLSLIHI